ncbi:hypothetical protein PV327_002684 [Microctonus hyperodae]|uniref:Ig-like domain-containing protein n=1 Tax=Microctonus hyperodae TaxID=165561 RepID=A0AA39FG93_MICHY|nr:hypothetical protein PV327_002684 [Microctonus hyperodae]
MCVRVESTGFARLRDSWDTLQLLPETMYKQQIRCNMKSFHDFNDMMGRAKVFWAMLTILLIYPNDNFGGAFQPEFAAPLANLTVPLGRDAMFTCLVEHLGGYRVGWIKADTKAIQAIHDHVITHNPRVSVSRSDHSTWNLHIKGVQLEDAGLYMCQINTDPMKSQVGTLTIEVPPDFVADETSGDVMIGEGGQVKLICRAKGVPQPRVNWRREDGKDIIIRESVSVSNGQKSKSELATAIGEYHGEELRLTKISRHDMGAYLCIASNGVPPAIIPPVIHVPNQLVGAPLGTDVSLECFVEASPKSINYWMKDNEEMIIASSRRDVQAVFKSSFQVRMLLNIRNLQKQDLGSYRCVAKNSLGSVDVSIRLSGKRKVMLRPDLKIGNPYIRVPAVLSTKLLAESAEVHRHYFPGKWPGLAAITT